nr:amidase family protein [Streptomyces sp. NBC_00899]
MARGAAPGPLTGVPLGVKDLLATAGVRTTGGSAVYADFVPDEDDVAVERVKAAGAVVLGKTNASEFGYSAVGHNPLFPATRNPWNTALTPGGSSAGSAAAVAAGLGPVALGTDGGCSIRVPAAHCGLVGYKPSMGRVPAYPGCRDERYPGMSGWESLEHIGPLTRTVADTALMMSVLAGPDPRDRHSIPCADVDWRAAASRGTAEGAPGLRVAYSPDLGYLAVDPRVREVVEAAVGVMERELRWDVTAVDPGWPDPAEAFAALIVAESDLSGIRAMADAHADVMSPHLVAWMRRPWTAEQLTDANITRKAVVNRMARLMSGYDLLVTPTAAVPPFPVGIQGPERTDGREVADTAWIGFNYPANLTGQPAVSLPAGFTDDGLPIGVQLVGRHLDDGTVLRAAAAFERVAPWAHHRPQVISGDRATDRGSNREHSFAARRCTPT